jgi:hypothetical protein
MIEWLLLPAVFAIVFYILRFFFSDSANFLTSFYALFIVIWCQFYINNWKQKCSRLMIHWDNYTDEYDKENTRKEFKGDWRTCPISGKPEIYYPRSKRIMHFFKGMLLILPVFAIAIFLNVCFMNMDGTIEKNTVFWIPILRRLNEDGRIFGNDGFLINILPIIQAQVIAFMNSQFHSVAIYTTNMENHKIKSNYQNTLILKRYIFEFMDNFMGFFYIAFVNQDFVALKFSIVSTI